MKIKTKHFIWMAAVLLLTACGQSEFTQEQASQRVNQVIPVVKDARVEPGQLALSEITTVVYEPAFKFEAEWLKEYLHGYLHHHMVLVPVAEWEGEKAIQLVQLAEAADPQPERYWLKIDASGIEVGGENNVGVLYGLSTLVQLLPDPESEACVEANFPLVIIQDAPRFDHRGLLLDCARHFMTTDFVKRTIDHLAFYKMNVLHWHLTEDQGWRIQIKAFPQLTEHGAWRDDGNGGTYGGFYTQDEIREVVAYAAERGVRVIPEIELPGHSSAAISAYPHLGCTGDSIPVETEWGVFQDVYCAGNDSTVAFLKAVMDEVTDLFPDDYVHIGGDEAPVSRWKACDKCQRRIATMGLGNEHDLQGWLITEIANHLEAKGKTIIGWDEILEAGDLPKTAVVQSWRGMDGGREAVEHGRRAIMSPTSHCYFDYPLSSTDLPEVFTFDPIPVDLSPQQAALIMGGECNMWSERAPQDIVESKIYPRLLGMSEVLWRQDSTARDYAAFEQALSPHYTWMDHMGVEYGFPCTPVSFTIQSNPEKVEVAIKSFVEGVVLSELIQHSSADGSWLSWDTTQVDQMHFEVGNPASEFKCIVANWRGREYESPSLVAIETHKGIGAKLNLLNGYSPNYTGGGPDALLDGIVDPTYGEYRASCWQALQGSNMVAEIEWERETLFTDFRAGFLEYANAWIFLPDSVTFETSMDGITWVSVQTQPLMIKGQNTWQERLDSAPYYAAAFEMQEAGLVRQVEPQFKQWFSWRNVSDPVLARFVRMTAHNIGTCPIGHDAEGQPAWLFCDEIVIN